MASHLIEELVKKFEEEGFIVMRGGSIKGVSGVTHRFDYVIEEPESRGRVAISLAGVARPRHVILMQIIRLDSQTPFVIFAKDIDPRALEILRKVDLMVIWIGEPHLCMMVGIPRENFEETAETILREILKLLASVRKN